MRIEVGLKARFLAASLGLAVVLISGFTLAIQQFIEVLEHEFVEGQFRDEFVQFANAWETTPTRPPSLPAGYSFRVVPHAALSTLPPVLHKLSPGVHAEVTVDGREYTVGRRDLGDRSLFMLLDAQYSPVERLEGQIFGIALGALAAAALIATAMALWLARVVLRPVEALARHAAAIVPGASRASFGDIGGDREITLIASAFDRTLDRFDELVENERAFARDASHELRTPLAVILSGIELLERMKIEDPLFAARLARLRSASEQMQSLTEGLLFLARPDGTASAPPYVASEVVREAIRIQMLATLPSQPDIQFALESDHRLDVPRGLLLCVVSNLLRNAIEHSGGRRVEVTLAADGLVVQDDGRGVDAAELATSFARHHRGADSAGEGLGLSIVQRICARLGWPLAVSTTPGAGTRFTLGMRGGKPGANNPDRHSADEPLTPR